METWRVRLLVIVRVRISIGFGFNGRVWPVCVSVRV